MKTLKQLREITPTLYPLNKDIQEFACSTRSPFRDATKTYAILNKIVSTNGLIPTCAGDAIFLIINNDYKPTFKNNVLEFVRGDEVVKLKYITTKTHYLYAEFLCEKYKTKLYEV